ncbi:MAG: hypothetical protein U0640_01585 [Phycisphaerales bacterium]
MARLPSPSKPWLHVWTPLIVAVSAAIAAMGGAVVAAIKAYNDSSKGEPWTLTVLVSAVLFLIVLGESLKVYKVTLDLDKQRRLEEVHEVQAACQVLREQLDSWFREQVEKLPEERRPTAFRTCMYSVLPANPKVTLLELERVTRYCVGEGGDRGEIGKRVSSGSGVVGLAFRTGKLQVADRQAADMTAFRDEMIADWGFDAESAKSLNETRWSFLAVPINTSEGKVDAILFVDSELKNCFDESVVSTLVLPACNAAKMVVERRYGNG